MIDSTQNCAVIFRGELVEGSNTETIKERLMAAFKLNRPQVDKLLTNNGTILKRGLSADQAARYQASMQQLGLICHIAKRNNASTAKAEKPAEKGEASVTEAEAPATTSDPQHEAEPITKLTQQMVESAFRGNFKTVAIDRKYMMGITATATLMLLLPILPRKA